jgi:DNA-binding MarR family transcriptional regulator
MSHDDAFVTIFQKWLEVSKRRSMRNFLRYARESRLSMSQLGALFHVHRLGSSGVTDLGDHLGVTSAAASQMLERLVQQDLISRSEDPNDRRVKQIILTEKGLRFLEESIHASRGWVDSLAESLTASEKEEIQAALEILIDKTSRLKQSIESEC